MITVEVVSFDINIGDMLGDCDGNNVGADGGTPVDEMDGDKDGMVAIGDAVCSVTGWCVGKMDGALETAPYAPPHWIRLL